MFSYSPNKSGLGVVYLPFYPRRHLGHGLLNGAFGRIEYRHRRLYFRSIVLKPLIEIKVFLETGLGSALAPPGTLVQPTGEDFIITCQRQIM